MHNKRPWSKWAMKKNHNGSSSPRRPAAPKKITQSDEPSESRMPRSGCVLHLVNGRPIMTAKRFRDDTTFFDTESHAWDSNTIQSQKPQPQKHQPDPAHHHRAAGSRIHAYAFLSDPNQLVGRNGDGHMTTTDVNAERASNYILLFTPTC